MLKSLPRLGGWIWTRPDSKWFSSSLELLEFFDIELIFSNQSSDGASLDHLTIDELTMRMPVTRSLPNKSPNDFWGADLICRWGLRECEQEHALRERWVTSEVCWTPSRLWCSPIWFDEVAIDLKYCDVELSMVEVTLRLDRSEVWVDLQVLSWWLWLDHRESCWIYPQYLDSDDCIVCTEDWLEWVVTYLRPTTDLFLKC